MSWAIPTIAAAVGSFVVLWTLVIWARCHAQDLRAASEMLDDHYRAANALIQDPQTPTSVIRLVMLTSQFAGSPAAARRLVWGLLFGQMKKSPSASAAKLRRDIEGMSRQRQNDFGQLIATSMLSSAAADPLFSRCYLLALNLYLSQSGQVSDKRVSLDRAETAALVISDRECSYA